jgi:UDPglucose--hexose-1-phosphate uridylyltransferase
MARSVHAEVLEAFRIIFGNLVSKRRHRPAPLLSVKRILRNNRSMDFPAFHLRKDPVVDRWVLISRERGERPGQQSAIHGAQAGPCPFCEGNEALTPPEILACRPSGSGRDERGWTVRVVPNKFPALISAGEPSRSSNGLFEFMNGAGAHEVIIETPEHETDMSRLSQTKIEQVLRVYRDRFLDLAGDPKLVYVLIFKNQGFEAGATMDHAHSQLIAMPLIPREALAEIEGAQNFLAANGQCVYCEIIERESADDVRVVSETDEFLSFCPFASRFPFETWILPKRHAARFELTSDNQLADLARALKGALDRLARALDRLSFNYFIHSLPLKGTDGRAYHWHLEILPRRTPVAGFEWGSGFTINAVPPEEAARLLRGSDGARP